jgi:hypothetical protein
MRVVDDFATSVPQIGQCGVPRRAIIRRRWSKISVTVPTVDRGFRLTVFWSIARVGEMPSTESTAGRSISPRNCRAYADSDSTNRRWPS